MKRILFITLLLAGFATLRAANSDYKNKPEYLALRDSMRNAFNEGDSTRFFPALKRLEDYLLEQNDLHAYYTQRCNEIVFNMNRQRILEAYKLSRQLSQELRDKQLDKEMYMAHNMLGHINRYCGNKEAAKRNFRDVIAMMEKAGYYESMPPIYMNIVNVSIDDDPEEAAELLDKAADIAAKYSPERVFDIETRRTLSYFNSGDTVKFMEGYRAYRQGVAEGKTSVHGRTLEAYYEAVRGNIDKAISIARENQGDDANDIATKIYEIGGRWKDAYESLRKQTEASDSVNNVVLANSMQGIRDELRLYDIERANAKSRQVTLTVIIVLLLLLIMAMCYIIFSRRRHMAELKEAYERVLEVDKLKSKFIQNMSHEVRTPLNVILGFAQVMANPELSDDPEKRKEMANMMLKNTHLVTNQIDEMLELSVNEASGLALRDDNVEVNPLFESIVHDKQSHAPAGVALHFNSSLPPGFRLMTQKRMLQRMISELLENAVKNTSKGTITLAAGADAKLITITVEDTGSGIPKAEAERIFERFVKLDSFKAGLGLGLPLCRIIATRLGGSISLDPTYTGGARFVITLPL